MPIGCREVEEKKDFENGAPDRIRTCDLWNRNPTLYPAELRVHPKAVLTRRSDCGHSAVARAHQSEKAFGRSGIPLACRVVGEMVGR